MRSRILILLFLLIFISCNQKKYSNKSIILFENSNFIIYSSKKNIDNVYQKWLNKNKKNNFIGIINDKKIYSEICNRYPKEQVNAFKIARDLDVLKRLNYVTADLLEQNNAYVYNRMTKKNEIITIDHFSTGRAFKVKDKIIFEVFDIIYWVSRFDFSMNVENTGAKGELISGKS